MAYSLLFLAKTIWKKLFTKIYKWSYLGFKLWYQLWALLLQLKCIASHYIIVGVDVNPSLKVIKVFQRVLDTIPGVCVRYLNWKKNKGMAINSTMNGDSVESTTSRNIPLFNLLCTSYNCIISLFIVGWRSINTSSKRCFFGWPLAIEIVWSAWISWID